MLRPPLLSPFGLTHIMATPDPIIALIFTLPPVFRVIKFKRTSFKTIQVHSRLDALALVGPPLRPGGNLKI